MPDQPDSQFLTTQWTLILGESESASPGPSKVLVALCECYRDPILSYIRRATRNSQSAEDLCQSFFTHLIEKRIYRTTSPERGKFRAFLLASVKNFLRNEYRNASRQKRGGGEANFSIDQDDFASDHSQALAVAPADDAIYDRDWAHNVFDQVWTALENEYRQSGQIERFALLKPTLTQPSHQLPYSELAQKLNLSVNGAKSVVFQLRSRFRELFRTAVAQIVEDPSELDQEIQYLVQIIVEKNSS